MGLSSHLYGRQSTHPYSETLWSDYQPSAQEGFRYRQGGRQEDETQVMISYSPPVVLGLVLSVPSTRETIRELVPKDLSVSN
jgi:hypothetical protein